ncbi:hypothetical protein [Stieleria neptunia]|uniref:hypothetical protein n=1 Tax=Stieleria neptunia TaxID=2527979 RepID=UPI00119E9496|nr:hypothetical protein [Stieleria neptunia]
MQHPSPTPNDQHLKVAEAKPRPLVPWMQTPPSLQIPRTLRLGLQGCFDAAVPHLGNRGF